MPGTEGTVYVRGLRELNRDLGRLDKTVQRELQAALRVVAEPVAVTARSNAEKFGPAVADQIRAGSSRGQAVVRQNARRTTGKRPDFGVTVMTKVLIPALEENEEVIVKGVEAMLDTITLGNGFH
jgi:hypothetical protein